MTTVKRAFKQLDPTSLSQEERLAVRDYTDGGSLWINRYLRGFDLSDLSAKDRNGLARKVKVFDGIFKRQPKSFKSSTVYRGMEAIENRWKRLKRGDELLLTQKGMISTTFNRSVALDFLEEDKGDRKSCLLILSLPRGTTGIYLGASSVWDAEDELLLPPGTVFRVTKRRTFTHKGVEVIAYHAVLESQP